jgi:chemotaxis methyl-accepting protein methylase
VQASAFSTAPSTSEATGSGSFANFFRHSEHIEDIFRTERAKNRPFRAWNVGCGGGETAYAIAMMADRHSGKHATWEVIGSDTDEQALQRAKSRRYQADDIATIPEPYRTTYCRNTRVEDTLTIDLRLRRRVMFTHLDPYHLLPPFLPFDLIFLDSPLDNECAAPRPITHLLPLLSKGGYLVCPAGQPLGTDALIPISNAVFQRQSV